MLSSLAAACMDLKLAISASILLSLACMASTSCVFGVRGWDDMKANMICHLEVVFAIEVGRVEVINVSHGGDKVLGWLYSPPSQLSPEEIKGDQGSPSAYKSICYLTYISI
jgi:hypothetical protein